MPFSRRSFLQKTAQATIVAPFLRPGSAKRLESLFEQKALLSPEELATDEDFWFQVRQAFPASANVINLNNGGVSPHPQNVSEALETYERFSNEAPGLYMWRTLGKLRERVRRKLADLGGCEPEQVAIMRNATEALNTVIMGADLKPGDEVLTTDQDYPNMLHTLDMRARREGIKVNKISLPVATDDPQELLNAFRDGMTARTKLVLACHVVNRTGQILPVKEIGELAHENGAEMAVDGAHSYANIPFSIPDLDCDYYGTSLHKWLCAPFGTGMLYVKPEKIRSLWPLMGYPEGEEEKITKFEHLGTRAFSHELGISHAIDFHNGIGTARKHARLQYLKHYWTDKVKDIPDVKFHTNLSDERSTAVVNLAIKNMSTPALSGNLYNRYQIYVSMTQHPDCTGLRISPQVYTSLDELDLLAVAIRDFASEARQ
ncbi:MAG: aminotransferase class V-fold PLP-dependent enzyme [Bacteroidota bacterium]